MDYDELTPQQKADQQRFEAFKRELYRRSMDTIRVYNDTDEDFTVPWDGYNHVVPNRNKDLGWGPGMRVMYRYLAEWYRRHMTEQQINALSDATLNKLKDVLLEKGDTDAVYNANDRFQRSRQFRTNDQTLVKPIWQKIWLGTVDQFGLDQVIDEPTQEENKTDLDKLALEFDELVYKATDKQPKKEETPVDPKQYPINKRSITQEVAK